MIFLKLAWKSLLNRRYTSLLTLLSIALSTALLLSVERTRRAAEDGFTSAISQTDLIVGARSGPLNLLLYTVFNMGSATNSISWQSYQEIKNNPAVEWTIPYVLGDGHEGFRVVATDENFYLHYRYRSEGRIEFAEGAQAASLWQVVLGSQVAKNLKYKMGQDIFIAHGVTHGKAIQHHDDKPFKVVGIMKSTGTVLDTSLYITLKSMEAIHIDWKSGAAPTKATAIAADQIKEDDIKVDLVTAFFLRTKSRIETLRLQRSINEFAKEPLLAIIPGVALAELWRGLSFAERALKMISWMVVAVGLMAMLIALLTGLNERRREMAILRSVGASPFLIAKLLMFESTLLTAIGILLGLSLELASFSLLRSWLESEFGLYLVGEVLTGTDLLYLAVTLVLGICIGLIPAIKASKNALKDGLSVKL